MNAERAVFANIGAEEPDAPPNEARDRLGRAFTDVVARAPWPWLARARGLIAWLNVAAAAREASARGLALWGAPVDVVRAVHDKAFTLSHPSAHASALHGEPGVAAFSADAASAFPSALLDATQMTPAHVARVVDTWPAWARASFTLKPRWGTSGRGRARGANGALAPDAIGALPRFAAHGGAVVETWAARVLDLSSLWFVDDTGAPHVVGTTLQRVRPSGVYLGCTFALDDGGARADTAWDARVLDEARPFVARAAALGYRGPLGVDAFVWRHPETGAETLRAVVEVNARFTAGHVAIGLALLAGAHARFAFTLDQDPPLSRTDTVSM
jgi:hypothetical protein